MRIYQQVIIKLSVLVFIILWLGGGVFAGADTLVNFRFYEGLKGNDLSKTSVITSYYLRPLFVGNIVSEIGVDQEKDELKRIFNLENLKLMTRTHWGWKGSQKEKRLQVIILNGHEFMVKLAVKEKPDSFKLEVIEKDKANNGNKVLLDSDIILPEEKTTVFGFEDSMDKSYFLSLHREKNQSVIREDMAIHSSGDRPKLLKRISPVYPQKALDQNIEGTVILNITVDNVGKVKNVDGVIGNPLLKKAAIDAVTQWEYEPFPVRGKAQETILTVDVTFSLPGNKNDDNGTDKKIKGESPDIPSVWPSTGHLTSRFGKRIHPFTKKEAFHRGIDIAAAKGTPVKATADGEVIAADKKDIDGNYLIINHKNGYTTYYGRLNSFTVKKGDQVKRFDVIGYVGNTGQSTAPHLHYEVRYKDKPIDPMTLIID